MLVEYFNEDMIYPILDYMNNLLEQDVLDDEDINYFSQLVSLTYDCLRGEIGNRFRDNAYNAIDSYRNQKDIGYLKPIVQTLYDIIGIMQVNDSQASEQVKNLFSRFHI